ncbi:MAG: GNAT family N-acetyltransferase [Caldimonas sp.]
MARSEARKAPLADLPDPLRFAALTSADIEAALALSDAAGWNQTGNDWAIFIGRGHAIGLRDAAGRLVATAAALPYGSERGWISMVLVAEAWRHRGLASRLMDACIDHLRGAGIVPVLDATPAGAAVYRRIGFVAGFEIDRWEWPSRVDAATGAPVARPAPGELDAPRPAGAADLARLAALDRAATGLERGVLLESFLARHGSRAWLSADGRGFVVTRAGRRATQIGPLAAAGSDAAIALLGSALAAARAAGEPSVFLDLPRDRGDVAAWLEGRGFARQRPFVRMSLGAGPAPVLGAGSFVLAGPEFG